MLRYILFFKILLFSDCKKCHSSWKDLCGRLGGGAIVYSWECDILGRARGSLCVQPLLHHTLHLWVTFDATRCTLALTTPVQCIVTIKYYSQPGHRVHFCVNFIAPRSLLVCCVHCIYSNWPQLRCRNFSDFTFNHKSCKSQIMKLKCCCLNHWIFVISTVLRIFQIMATPIPQQSMFCWNIASQLEYLPVKTGNTKSANLEPENAETVGILVHQLYLVCEEEAQLCFCRQANMERALLMLLLPPNHR